MTIFVVSDVHGMHEQFEQILSFWDENSTLVLLGDLVNRGPQSLQVIQKAMALQAQYGEQVVFCRGNHENMLLDFLRQPEDYYSYLSQGVRETLYSFIEQAPLAIQQQTAMEIINYVNAHFQSELDFLASGQSHAIIGRVLLTHAGFDSKEDTIAASTEQHFLWVRDHYLTPNETPYVNVFGHTPTKRIHKGNDIWLSDDQKYIGIDGGCFFGGQLNAVLLTDEGEVIATYCAKNDNKKWYEGYVDTHFLNCTFGGILFSVKEQLDLSNEELASALNTFERRIQLLLENKLHLDQEDYAVIRNQFWPLLNEEQHGYLMDWFEKPKNNISQEAVARLLGIKS